MADFQRMAGFRPARGASAFQKMQNQDSFLEVIHAVSSDAYRVCIHGVQVDEDTLPASFDWRNVDGQNYVDPVVDQVSPMCRSAVMLNNRLLMINVHAQGACGACYAVSTGSMINSRIRILTKNREKTNVNTNQIIDCNRYSQACCYRCAV